MSRAKLTRQEKTDYLVAGLGMLAEADRRGGPANLDPATILKLTMRAMPSVASIRRSAQGRGLSRDEVERELAGLIHEVRRIAGPMGLKTHAEMLERVDELVEKLEYPPFRTLAPSLTDPELKKALELLVTGMAKWTGRRVGEAERQKALREFDAYLASVAREKGRSRGEIGDEFRTVMRKIEPMAKGYVALVQTRAITADQAAQSLLNFLEGA
jgi:hypothetical protein